MRIASVSAANTGPLAVSARELILEGGIMWTLEELRARDIDKTCIDGCWVPARPLDYRTVWQRLRDALAVFIGRAEAFRWPKGQ